jgi:hypothetical protein
LASRNTRNFIRQRQGINPQFSARIYAGLDLCSSKSTAAMRFGFSRLLTHRED